MKKKSYNPFKMWGSYVGAGIFSIGSIIRLLQFMLDNTIIERWLETGINLTDGGLILFLMLFSNINSSVLPIIYGILIVMIIINVIFGFLIGWGIHSLVRMIRRK